MAQPSFHTVVTDYQTATHAAAVRASYAGIQLFLTDAKGTADELGELSEFMQLSRSSVLVSGVIIVFTSLRHIKTIGFKEYANI